MLQAKWLGGINLLLLFQVWFIPLVWSDMTAAQLSGDRKLSPLPNASTPTSYATGSGYAFAESCQAELRRWSAASSTYGREHGHRSISYYTGNMTVHSASPQSTKVTSLITLCDGYPRVVGQISTESEKTSVYKTTWTNTNPTFVFATYPTPAPCSIGPEDCKLLYSSWTSHWNAMTKARHSDGLLDPPCTTRSSSYSYSTNSNGDFCDNCQIIGSKIRLLYWPVVTKAGSGNLCNKTAETVSATPTGDGPNTFETLGITITSPSVAVSIAGLSRVDKCGTTIADTIIPVLPEDVSSVDGARALFTHTPFNFANLNYKCLSDPDVIYIITSDRTDCYQQVPASAYFYGYANAAGAEWWSPQAFANSTIWPGYQPQVVPPNTLTAAIRSIWGESCNIHPDGVWDPPIALQHRTSIPLPVAGPGSPTDYATPTSNPAMPAMPAYAQPSITRPKEPSTHTGHDTSIQASSPTTLGSNGGSVQVVRTTLLTLPANHGAETLRVIYGEGKTVLVNDGSSVLLNSAESATQRTSLDPEKSFAVTSQLLTNNGAEYAVAPLSHGGFQLIGQSTTLKIHDNDAKTTPSAGTLAIAAAASSLGDESSHQAPSQSRGDHSASNSGVRKALMTCVYLSLVAVLVAVFL